jgi:4,5-dihydroxyphthalate decarboxylase
MPRMNTKLSIVVTSNPRTQPVIDGRAAPEGIDLAVNVLDPGSIFARQLRAAEFDIAEMSMASLLMALDSGDARFIGIPVFTTKRFFHTNILVRRDAGIESPADLKGKRVGLPEYQQTAAVWIRGFLQSEFGVTPHDLEFWMERTPDQSNVNTAFAAPPGVTVHHVPPEKSLGSMMVSGELQACLIYYGGHPGERSTENLVGHPDIKRLFSDRAAEGARYYQKSGIYPVNHGMIIRRDIVHEDSRIAASVLKAFSRASAIADRERMEHVANHFDAGLLPGRARGGLETPLFEHGIKANRKTIEAIATYACDQGLTSRVFAVDEIFAEGTLSS